MLSASQTATQPTNPISQSSRERRLSPSIVWPAAARLRSSRNPGCSPKALEVTVILSALLSEEFAGALRCRRFVWTRVGEAASVVDSPTRGGTALIHRRCWHGLPPYERPWSMRRARDAETDADAPTRTGTIRRIGRCQGCSSAASLGGAVPFERQRPALLGAVTSQGEPGIPSYGRLQRGHGMSIPRKESCTHLTVLLEGGH